MLDAWWPGVATPGATFAHRARPCAVGSFESGEWVGGGEDDERVASEGSSLPRRTAAGFRRSRKPRTLSSLPARHLRPSDPAPIRPAARRPRVPLDRPSRPARPAAPQARPGAASSTGAVAGSTTAMASVADKIHTILEAAEATAAAIRQEAEADAERAARERRRRDDARDELSHLSRLADALSVQAEAVSRQCDIVGRVLLPPEDDAGAGADPAERTSPPVEARPAAGPEPSAGSEPAARAAPTKSPRPPSPRRWKGGGRPPSRPRTRPPPRHRRRPHPSPKPRRHPSNRARAIPAPRRTAAPQTARAFPRPGSTPTGCAWPGGAPRGGSAPAAHRCRRSREGGRRGVPGRALRESLARGLESRPRGRTIYFAGQAAAGGRGENRPSRKVRTPQGGVVGETDPGKPAGKCHRNDTA